MGTPVRTAASTERRRHVNLVPEPESVRAGRHWLRDTLADVEVDHPLDEDRVDAALVTLSEILTNAVRHTQSKRCSIVVAWSTSHLLLGVADDAPDRMPAQRRHEDYDVDGRGLFLVDQLADDWGCRVIEGMARKIVWARFNGSAQFSAVPGNVPGPR
jgi:anti-sigma regulatory factor (Ser/Thr protein kinase)